MAASLELDNVIFMSPVSKVELPRLLSCVHAGLMVLANVPAFYYGTSPNKFFDYIAMGIPVLNNYPGWLAEMIGKHSLGISVPPDDAGSFADALEQLADDREAAQAMGANARALARAEFDRSRLAAELVTEIVLAAKR